MTTASSAWLDATIFGMGLFHFFLAYGLALDDHVEATDQVTVGQRATNGDVPVGMSGQGP